MAEHLHLGGQATHLPTENAPLAGEATRRVRPVAPVLHAVDAIAGPVELDGMDVDLPTSRIEQHNASRQLPFRHLVAVPAKHSAEQRHIRASDDEIEIVVLARLLAEQRVDAPTPVEPDLDPIQPVEQPDDVLGAHRHSRVTLVVDGPFHDALH